MRSLALVLILASSMVIAIGQTPEQGGENDKNAKITAGIGNQKLRDLPFPSGIDLQFIIKMLARDLDLNVVFDTDSFRSSGRKTYVDLRNVTSAAALDYILSQERLVFEEIGPRAILVANQLRRPPTIPQIGVATTPLTEQLAQYFGVDGGVLINTVRDNSPASKGGLRARDVIVEIDGVPVNGPLGIERLINEKNAGDVVLTFVRDRKRQTIVITLAKEKGIEIVLQNR